MKSTASSFTIATHKLLTLTSLRPPWPLRNGRIFSGNSPKAQTLMKNLAVFERALIGAAGGGIAGAFTYVCLHPLDTIKTKMQTKGASQIYKNTFDAIIKTFQTKGILGFYSGVSTVIVGSTASSAVYFGTCEFGKSFLSKFEKFPSVLIPPMAGTMGNIVSSASAATTSSPSSPPTSPPCKSSTSSFPSPFHRRLGQWAMGNIVKKEEG